MCRPLWFAFAGLVLLGAAAAAAVLVLTDPDRGGAPAAVRAEAPQVAPRPPPVVASPLLAPSLSQTAPGARPVVATPLPAPSLPVSPAEAPSPQAVQPGEPPPGAAAYQSPEERGDSLTEMQQQRMKRGMDALNERGARRAAQARPVPTREPSR